jgi:hypothetical protein
MCKEILEELVQLERLSVENLVVKEKSQSELEGELETAKDSADDGKIQGEIDKNQ